MGTVHVSAQAPFTVLLVEPGGGALASGKPLKGDVITEINGRRVEGMVAREFAEALSGGAR